MGIPGPGAPGREEADPITGQLPFEAGWNAGADAHHAKLCHPDKVVAAMNPFPDGTPKANQWRIGLDAFSNSLAQYQHSEQHR